MKPVEIHVPDALWKNSTITEAAKILWCFLCALQPRAEFSMAELQKLTGFSHHTIAHSLRQLQAVGLVDFNKKGLHLDFCVVTSDSGLRVPSDILLQPLPRPAKWIWAVLRTLDRPVTYQELQALTGYSLKTIRNCVRALLKAQWLVIQGTGRRPVRLKTLNPAEARRLAEIERWEQRLAEELRGGLSRGQCLLYLTVRMALPSARIVVNARLHELTNPLTDAELEIDIYLPEYRLGIEYNGPQHYGTTEWFSEEQEFRTQRARDLMKLGLCRERGIHLIVLTVEDLWPSRIWRMLAEKVPVREIPDQEWHLVRWLYRQVRQYRRSVSRGNREP